MDWDFAAPLDASVKKRIVGFHINTGWIERFTGPLRVATRSFYFAPTMNRTAFLIDGFNLYHSAKSASLDLGLNGAGTRWLNIHSLCKSYLHAIGGNAQIAAIHYFSALAKHIEAFKPDVVKKHLLYIECLKATGISVELSRFKKKQIPCPPLLQPEDQTIRRERNRRSPGGKAAGNFVFRSVRHGSLVDRRHGHRSGGKNGATPFHK
jgi:hypothetical protein